MPTPRDPGEASAPPSRSGDVFDEAWLTLREPADHRARSDTLARTLGREARRRRWDRIVDLGAGTGSNRRYLLPRLGRTPSWSWTLVDHDAALLSRAAADGAGDRVRTVVADLADLAVGGPTDRTHRTDLTEPADLTDTDVITASALIDLVSERWLRALVDRCVAKGAGVLFALTYDGTIEWSDGDPDDELVRATIDRHQRSEKGMGPALGPDGHDAAAALFESAGYDVSSEATPWRLDSRGDAPLMAALLEGWVGACEELSPDRGETFRAWGRRRLHALHEGRASVHVGHHDLLALPAG